MTQITNNILKSEKVMPQFKIGALTPVPKAGKKTTNPDNNRRITVCSIVGKVPDREVVIRSNKVLNPAQSDQQFGFTKGCSPSNCTLLQKLLQKQKIEMNLCILHI